MQGKKGVPREKKGSSFSTTPFRDKSD